MKIEEMEIGITTGPLLVVLREPPTQEERREIERICRIPLNQWDLCCLRIDATGYEVPRIAPPIVYPVRVYLKTPDSRWREEPVMVVQCRQCRRYMAKSKAKRCEACRRAEQG